MWLAAGKAGGDQRDCRVLVVSNLLYMQTDLRIVRHAVIRHLSATYAHTRCSCPLLLALLQASQNPAMDDGESCRVYVVLMQVCKAALLR